MYSGRNDVRGHCIGDGQYSDKPTRGQSGRTRTGQLADSDFFIKFTVDCYLFVLYTKT